MAVNEVQTYAADVCLACFKAPLRHDKNFNAEIKTKLKKVGKFKKVCKAVRTFLLM